MFKKLNQTYSKLTLEGIEKNIMALYENLPNGKRFGKENGSIFKFYLDIIGVGKNQKQKSSH